jgi:hypothetical protein
MKTILAIGAGLLVAIFAFVVNSTIGIEILHFGVPIFWCTVGNNNPPQYCWNTIAIAIDWIFRICVVLPSAFYGFYFGYNEVMTHKQEQ